MVAFGAMLLSINSPLSLPRFLWVVILLAVFDLLAMQGYVAWVDSEMPRPERGATDVIAVLFNDLDDAGNLNAETRRRINHAHALYQRGAAQRVVCIGGTLSRNHLVGAVLMREALIEAGVPYQQALTAPPSFDSTTNLEALATMAAHEQWRSATLVSSAHHLLRVRHELAGIDAAMQAVFSPYDPGSARPGLRFHELWIQIHYEWIAWALTSAMPRAALQAVARTLRYYL